MIVCLCVFVEPVNCSYFNVSGCKTRYFVCVCVKCENGAKSRSNAVTDPDEMRVSPKLTAFTRAAAILCFVLVNEC